MPTSINIKNTNQRNQIRVGVSNATTEEKEVKDPKTGKVSKIKETHWSPSITTYLKPGEQTDVWVAENRQIIVQEMPT